MKEVKEKLDDSGTRIAAQVRKKERSMEGQVYKVG